MSRTVDVVIIGGGCMGVSTLPAGDYYIVAVDGIQQGAWYA